MSDVDVSQKLGLIVVCMRRLGIPESEDAIQEGTIGLIEAKRRWDPSKGAFSTYAYNWVRRYLMDWWKSEFNWNRFGFDTSRCGKHWGPPSRSLDSTPMEGEGKTRSELVAATDTAIWEQGVYKAAVQKAISKLPEKTRIAMAMRLDNKRYREIGQHLGVTRQRACQLVDAGTEAVRRELA